MRLVINLIRKRSCRPNACPATPTAWLTITIRIIQMIIGWGERCPSTAAANIYCSEPAGNHCVGEIQLLLFPKDLRAVIKSVRFCEENPPGCIHSTQSIWMHLTIPPADDPSFYFPPWQAVTSLSACRIHGSYLDVLVAYLVSQASQNPRTRLQWLTATRTGISVEMPACAASSRTRCHDSRNRH